MDAPPSIGAILVGFGVACFLCGCMLVQMYIYVKSEAARRDTWRIKILVSTALVVIVRRLLNTSPGGILRVNFHILRLSKCILTVPGFWIWLT
jgi:hypothetical protein